MKDLSVSIFYRRYHDFQAREGRRISRRRNLCLLLSTRIISSDWAEVTTCLLTLATRMCAPDLQRRRERRRKMNTQPIPWFFAVCSYTKSCDCRKETTFLVAQSDWRETNTNNQKIHSTDEIERKPFRCTGFKCIRTSREVVLLPSSNVCTS